ncbi:MAG: ABC transporter substrate-binding protein, partial [Fibrobacteraceae bacterium]|nr:ABC transporter substrate-binding protein [Fibrobacteraceae bacterium]
YWPAMGTGNFDLVMHKPSADVSPSLPWSRFNEVMGVARDWQPIGAWASVNIGRYNNPASSNYRPEVDSLLGIIPLLKNEQDKIDAYEKLNMVFMVDQPAIPLVYLPEKFYYFNDKIWKNWPTQKNPYAPPQIPDLGSGTNILWHIYSK